jgi:hypothetical protein
VAVETTTADGRRSAPPGRPVSSSCSLAMLAAPLTPCLLAAVSRHGLRFDLADGSAHDQRPDELAPSASSCARPSRPKPAASIASSVAGCSCSRRGSDSARSSDPEAGELRVVGAHVLENSRRPPAEDAHPASAAPGRRRRRQRRDDKRILAQILGGSAQETAPARALVLKRRSIAGSGSVTTASPPRRSREVHAVRLRSSEPSARRAGLAHGAQSRSSLERDILRARGSSEGSKRASPS